MPCLQFAMQGIFLIPHSRWYNNSMEIDMDKRHWEHGPCPKHDCRKDSCKCGLRLISFPAALGDDSKGSPVAPKNGDYCNALVKYESNGHMYVYSTEGVPERLSSNGTLNFEELLNRPQYNGEVMTGETNIPEVPSAVSQLTNDLDFQTGGEVNSTVTSAVATETTARQHADNTLQSAITGVSNALGAETTARQNADTALQNSITTVSNNLSSEVTARQNADTAIQNNITTVSNNLSSETTARQNADNNLQSQIDGISASSDVKDVVGTYAELQAYDTSTLGNNDIIKVLQDEAHSDETTYYRWSTTTQTFTLIGEEGPYYTKAATDALLAGKQDTLTIAQAPGQSTTSVMSQKATTEMVFDKFGGGVNINPADSGISQDPEFKYSINIGQDTNNPSGSGGMVLVGGQSTGGQYSTTIGFHTQGLDGSTLIGSFSADETVLPVQDKTVSFGSDHAQVFTNEYGVQSTKPAFTRRLINVSTPVKNTDAATKDYVDNSLSGKQNALTAGSNITISGSTISATDTTYSAFVGTDGQTAGSAGLVPAPTAADANKVLKSDGTWGAGGGGESMIVENVTGATPTITAQSSHIYICGTVDTLDFTPSATGVCEVIFTSGATPTTLVVPNTVRMPDWFVVQPNSTYEISIFNGIYGAVTVWNQ